MGRCQCCTFQYCQWTVWIVPRLQYLLFCCIFCYREIITPEFIYRFVPTVGHTTKCKVKLSDRIGFTVKCCMTAKRTPSDVYASSFFIHFRISTPGFPMLKVYIWPASHEKGPLDISHSVDPDQLLHDIENSYTLANCLQSKKYNVLLVWRVSKSVDPDQTLRRRCSG